MDYKLKRQLGFGIGFVTIVALLSITAYQAFKSEASCFDGILNQGEEKADCGGPCPACKVTRPKDVEVFWYRAFLVGGTYDAVAQVRNPNSQYGIRSLSYSFLFHDQNKQVIAEKSGKAYLLANQTRYIIENDIAVPAPAAFVTFVVGQYTAWEEQPLHTGQISLPIFSKRYEKITSPEVGFAKVFGAVENQTEFTFNAVDIQVALVDGRKQTLAVGKTQVENLRVREKRSFVVFFPDEVPLPADIWAEATVNVFEQASVK